MTYVTRPRISIRSASLRACGLICLAATLLACGDDDGSDNAGGTGGGGGGPGGEGGAFTIEQPNRFRVRLDDDAAPAVVLELDKAKALEVFGEGGAKKITILEVETEKLLRNAIAQIQNACGTDWALDRADPKHDCSKTALGQSFGATPAEWRVSPEFALVRLLTMTPANANVTGTSLADFKELIDGNPDTFKFDFAGVLADSMKIARTAPFVPTDALIKALQRQLFASHPAVSDPSGQTMAVTLYEALNDLTPLATKLGPVGPAPWAAPGEHPGVLVPDDASFTTKSDVLLPDFKMRVVSDSGLRRVAGVNLARGGGDMYLREGDAPLRFDFNDPAKLQITGLAPNGTIDMRFAMHELAGVVPSCTDVPACQANLPPPAAPVGVGTVWTVAPFLLEPIVAQAAYLTYNDLSFSKCYFTFGGTCQTGVEIGNPKGGWAVFTNKISFDGLPPLKTPAPQFLWELLTEVAQVSVHDPTGDGTPDLGEGKAEPVYALRGVGIGLTSDEVLERLRPTLQSQAADIADIILGRYWLNNDPLDFFYSRDVPGGQPYLYFVAEGDLRPDDQGSTTPRAYGYSRPGFFGEPGLTEAGRVSAKNLAGVVDTVHEKYKLPRGASTLYMQGEGGAVYQVDFYVPLDGDPVEISAEVKKL